MLHAAFAEADITPPLGTHLSGSVAEHRPALSIADPLFAKVAVFQQGGRKLCIIALDITILHEPYTTRLRTLAHDRFGFEPASVMVHATQTHTAPSLGAFMLENFDLPEDAKWITGDDPAFGDLVIERTLGALQRACAALQPVSLAHGRTIEGRLAFNRRMLTRTGRAMMPWRGWLNSAQAQHASHLEGPIDPELAVLAVKDQRDQIIGLLLHYTCHPVHIFPEQIISADWPGTWAQSMRRQLGPTVCPVVLNGCCGDVNPWDPWDPHYPNDHHRMGRLLAESTGRAMTNLSFTSDAALDWSLKRIELPLREIDAQRVREAGAHLREHPQPVWTDSTHRFADRQWIGAALTVSQDRQQKELGAYPYEIQVLRVGDVAFVGLPGEPFAEGALHIKSKSPAKLTMTVHCTSHYAGYLPTRRAYPAGGHEADISTWSKFAPGALEMVIDAAIDTVHGLFPAKST